MKYLQTAQPWADDLLMASIRTIVQQELAKCVPAEPKDRLLTVSEAALLLRLAVPTIYGLVQRNQIPYIKKTKRIYFSEQKLEKWLEEGENNGSIEVEKAVDTYLSLHRSNRKKKAL